MQKETISNLIDDLKTETTALKQQVVALENKISTLREQLILTVDDKKPDSPISLEDYPLVLDCVKEMFQIGLLHCNGDYNSFNYVTHTLCAHDQQAFSVLIEQIHDLLEPVDNIGEFKSMLEKYRLDYNVSLLQQRPTK